MPEVRCVVFDAVHLFAQRTLDEEFAQAMHETPLGNAKFLPLRLQQESRAVVLQLVTYLYGQRIVDETVSYPKDWWEALKERVYQLLAWSWLEQRYPVRKTSITIKLTEVYPAWRPPKEGAYKIQVPVLEKYYSEDTLNA